MPTGIRPGVPEETGKNRPSFAEIRQRAREIHGGRGGHVCDMDNYLDEWLQAERERQKGSTGAGARRRRFLGAASQLQYEKVSFEELPASA